MALQDGTAIVVIGLTLLNAILGLNQEGKAAESVAALQKMLVVKAHVRARRRADRHPGGAARSRAISFRSKPGDKIQADGRLLIAATLEIEEAGLTGESTPTPKAVEPSTAKTWHSAIGSTWPI